METVDIDESETQLSYLIDAVASGREIIVARAGKPIAKLVPFSSLENKPRRVLGAMAGCFNIPADFDAPLPPEVLDSFEGC